MNSYIGEETKQLNPLYDRTALPGGVLGNALKKEGKKKKRAFCFPGGDGISSVMGRGALIVLGSVWQIRKNEKGGDVVRND